MTTRSTVFEAAIGAVLLGACGAGDPPVGPTPCGQNGACPTHYVCDVPSNLCVVSGSSGDAGVIDAPHAVSAAYYLYDPGMREGIRDSLSGFGVDPTTGALTPIDVDKPTAGSQVVIATGGNPLAAAATPNGGFLYVANGEASVSAYTIDRPTGALTPIDADSATAGLQNFPVGGPGGLPEYLLVDAAGAHLYVSKGSGSAIAVFSIGTDGVLTPGTPITAATPPEPRGMALSLSGDLLFVANHTFGSLSSFAVDAVTGALTNRQDFPVGTGPIHIVRHPTLKVLYVTNEKEPSGVFTFTYDDAGVLTQLGDPSPTGATSSSTIGAAVDPMGKWLYVASLADTAIDAFPIDSTTGALGATVRTATRLGGRTVTIDPGGKFLFLGNDVTGMSAFSIQTAGTLTPVPGAITALSGGYQNPIVVVAPELRRP